MPTLTALLTDPPPEFVFEISEDGIAMRAHPATPPRSSRRNSRPACSPPRRCATTCSLPDTLRLRNRPLRPPGSRPQTPHRRPDPARLQRPPLGSRFRFFPRKSGRPGSAHPFPHAQQRPLRYRFRRAQLLAPEQPRRQVPRSGRRGHSRSKSSPATKPRSAPSAFSLASSPPRNWPPAN